jgi:lysophospholipase L1-like esterase
LNTIDKRATATEKILKVREKYLIVIQKKRVEYYISTNSHGYRDSEIPVKKPPQTIRILVLGDSISFGYGVAANNVYSEYLENLLNSRTSKYHFDVINTAASGNSALHQYYDLQRGLKFSPDLIIQQFTLNDVTEPFKQSKRLGGYGHIWDYHRVDDVPYYDHLLQQYSSFYLFFKDMIQRATYLTTTKRGLKEKAQQREIFKAKNLIKQKNHPLIEKAWDEYFAWMRKINSIAKKSKIPIILLATPYEFQFSMNPSMAYPQEKLRIFSEKNKIIYIDLLVHLQKEFIDEETKKYDLSKNSLFSDIATTAKNQDKYVLENFLGRYFFDYDHFTPMGHKLAARTIYPRIKDILRLKVIDLSSDN